MDGGRWRVEDGEERDNDFRDCGDLADATGST